MLEAIHTLGLGRSFRSSATRELIRQQTDKFTLFAQVLRNKTHHNTTIGIERTELGALRWRVDEKEVSAAADVVSILPMRIINSHSHDLIELGPNFRRKFLDWGLFYQFDDFLPCFKRFEMSLKQRNTLLREKKFAKTCFDGLYERELDSWTEVLAKQAAELTQFRRQYVKLLLPFLMNAIEMLSVIPQAQIKYDPGWDEDRSYATILADNAREDCQMGYTQYGPHRADLEILINAVPAKHFLSRGQQKLLVCAMVLAQGALLSAERGNQVIYLVDDLPSELDQISRQKLIALLMAQQTQVFMTAIEKEMVDSHIQQTSTLPIKMFHVKHGEIVAK